jgi:hypothetical protein
VSYIGTATHHLWGSVQINPAVNIPGTSCTLSGATYSPCSSNANTDQRRRFSIERPADGALMGYVAQGDDGGNQSYHGMILSVERRAARGITINANYTWSHCIGYASIGATPGGVGSGYLKPEDRSFDRGNCSTDRRHLFNLTAVAQTPRFANTTLRNVASGWKVSGIYRKSSGSYLTVTAATDRQLSGASGQRLNQINSDPYCAVRTPSCWLNPAAFATPALGTLGNMGKSNIVGPGSFQFDAAVSREFRILEGHTLEIRAEAFNVTNSFRAGGVTTVQNASFGRILTAQDPRIMQFATKYVF